MDKLDVSLIGGFPFDLDDIEWLQNSLADPIRGIGKAFGSNFILSGCAVSGGGGVYDITAGWVVIDDEPCYWEGGTGIGLPGGVGLYSLGLVTSLQAGGDETFQDLTVQNAYMKRRATPMLTALAEAGVIPHTPITGPRLGDRLGELLGDSGMGEWHVIGASGEPAFQNGWAGTSSPNEAMFRKEPGGIVRMKGRIYGGASSADLVFQLPVGFRPGGTALSTTLCKSEAAPAVNVRRADLNSAGQLYVGLGGAPAGNDVFDLAAFPAFVAEG